MFVVNKYICIFTYRITDNNRTMRDTNSTNAPIPESHFVGQVFVTGYKNPKKFRPGWYYFDRWSRKSVWRFHSSPSPKNYTRVYNSSYVLILFKELPEGATFY